MKISVIRVKTLIHEGKEVANIRRRPIDTLETTVNPQLDLAGLPHQTFTDEALHLVLRVSEGVLRAVRNLCVGSLIEAVRDRTRTVDLKQVNAVLMQPHWHHNTRDEAQQPVVFTNQKPKG